MVRKLTQEEFEDRVYGQLGDRIDLSKFEYTGATGKSIAICPTHGEYLVSAASLSAGQACKQCYRERQASGGMAQPVETITSRAQEVHANKYEYDRGAYKNSKTAMKVLCPEHGEFWVTPEVHIKGQGCPKCSKIKVRKARVRGSDMLVPKMIEKWGDRFDFSHVSFEQSRDKFTLICKEHGEFQTSYRNFMKSTKGCPKCARPNRHISHDKMVAELYKKYKTGYTFDKNIITKGGLKWVRVTCEKHGEHLKTLNSIRSGYACTKCSREKGGASRRLSESEFLHRSKEKHGEKYDYSLIEYTRGVDQIQIVCPTHGKFMQMPCDHARGVGCPKCGEERRLKQRTLAQDEFIKRVIAMHGKTYDLSESVYKTSGDKVMVICPDHGKFEVIASMFVNEGTGCQKCAYEYNRLNRRIPDEVWLDRFASVHGDTYEYGEIVYNAREAKVNVKCDTHGWFEQYCKDHARGSGCLKCSSIYATKPQVEIFDFLSQHVEVEIEAPLQ